MSVKNLLRNRLLGLTAVGIFCAVGAQSASAAIIANWDFSTLAGGAGVWGPSPYAATNSDPNATVVGLTRGAGFGTPAATSVAAHAWGGTSFVTASTTEPLAIAGNQVATFSVTAAAGFATSFADLTAYNVRRSSTGPATGIWQYEIGAGSFVDIGSAITWGAITSSAGNAELPIDLSGITDLQNVAAGTTVTFRVVVWGSTNTAGTWYLNDPLNTTAADFGVEGTVAAATTNTPEPASMGILAIGAVGLLARRRKA